MNENEACSFTLDEVLEKYKSYNSEVCNMIASIRSILAKNEVTDEDYRLFSNFSEFNSICICQIHQNELPLSCVAVSMYNIFKDNLDALNQLNIVSAESESSLRLFKVFTDSPFNKHDLFRGLSRLITFLGNVGQLSNFQEDSIIAAQIATSKMSCVKKYLLNVSQFMNRMSVCKNDKERIAMIHTEIRGVMLNCIRNDKLSSEKEVKDYIDELKNVESMLMHYCDDSLKSESNNQAVANNPSHTEAPSCQDDLIEMVVRNADHTSMRKSIAIYYLFNEISDNLFSDGNKKAMARFASFLTGHNVDNIYTFFRNIFNEMDRGTPARIKDFEFVIKELEKINLGEVSDKIRRDMKGAGNSK